MAKAAKKKTKPSVRTTISIPREDHAELERIAKKKKVSVAWVVREAVDRYLEAESPLLRRRNR